MMKDTQKLRAEQAWQKYKGLVSVNRKTFEPVLPANLEYIGAINAQVDYVPGENMLSRIRNWLQTRGEMGIYYFLTESIPEEIADFDVPLSELRRDTLLALNKGSESVITGKDFSWAIFIDQKGTIHVSGSADLFALLQMT